MDLYRSTRGRGRGKSQSTRGGSTTNQRSITTYTTPKQSNIPIAAAEVVKRKRTDITIHKQGNPHPTIRAAANEATQPQAGSSMKINDVVADNNRKLDANGTKLDALLRGFDNFKSRVDEVEARVNLNSNNIADAGQRLNLLEQKSLNNQMEISGIDASKVPYSALRVEVTKFITSLGITLNPEHVVDVSKFNRTMRGAPRTIVIVTFIHEAIKRRVITEKIKLDRANGNCQVYFSEVLTKINRQIFMEARHLKKQKIIFSVWTASGEVFIKTHEGSERTRILSVEQLSELKQQEEYNSDESTYESVIQNRHVNPRNSQIPNTMATPKNNDVQPFVFSPKLTYEPRKMNFQRETSVQAFNYSNSNAQGSLTQPSTSSSALAHTSSSDKITANNPTLLTANNSSKITANNPSNITANNSSHITANNPTPTNNVNQQAHPGHINKSPSMNSLMQCDTPLIPTQVTGNDGHDFLLDLTGAANSEGTVL